MEEEEEGEDNDEEEEEGGSNEEEVSAADPRAGGVDVTLPQLKVDYQGLAEQLFSVGSSSGVKKSSREILYKLGKGFKDVVQGVFPLGPDVSDDEEVEKVSVSKGVKNLQKFEEKLLVDNMKNKKEYKKLLKKRKHENGTVPDSQTNGDHSVNGLDESDDDSQVVEDSAEKPSDHKEKEKKRKREQKRRR